MNKNVMIAVGVVVVAVLAGSVFLGEKTPAPATPVTDSANEEVPPSSVATYETAALGLAFEYKTGAQGYTIYERNQDGEPSTHVASLALVHENERAMMEDPVPYTEGPMSISVEVFTNSEKQFPLVWARANNAYSNIELAQGDIEETVVGGASALRYRVDGLYQMMVVVVAHGSKVYVISSSYLDTTSSTYQDFDPLLLSLRFIPEPGQL